MAGKKQKEKTRAEAQRFAQEMLERSKEFILLAMTFEEDEDGAPIDPNGTEVAQILSVSSGSAVAWMEVLKQTAQKVTEEFPEQVAPFLAARAATSLMSLMKEMVKEDVSESDEKFPFTFFPMPDGDEQMH